MNQEYSSKKVYCVELDKWFPSISEAERYVGAGHGTIGKVLDKNNRNSYGYTWNTTGEKTVATKYVDKNKVKVRCIETGQVFDSKYECSKWLFGNQARTKKSQLHNALKHNWKIKGYTFETV